MCHCWLGKTVTILPWFTHAIFLDGKVLKVQEAVTRAFVVCLFVCLGCRLWCWNAQPLLEKQHWNSCLRVLECWPIRLARTPRLSRVCCLSSALLHLFPPIVVICNPLAHYQWIPPPLLPFLCNISSSSFTMTDRCQKQPIKGQLREVFLLCLHRRVCSDRFRKQVK